MNRQRFSLWFAAWLVPLIFLFCSNDYNPFIDQSKARAVVIRKTFNDVDTLTIFTTETLVVAVAVRELVDSFSVVAPSNRRAADTFVVRKKAGQVLSAGPYTCLVSLTDTGWKTITINTFRSNGERVPQDFSVFCRSPLGQNAITGAYGDSVRLSTMPVGDSDVIYHWDFGPDFTVTSALPQTSAVVKMQSLMTTGALWVSDPSGLHVSPCCAFSYNLIDSTGPIIMCANGPYKGDTIVTGDTTFYFKVKIWDPAQMYPVLSAAINGRQFDINDDPVYVRIFDRMDTFKLSTPVVVTAVDNQYNHNSSRKTFWFRFSDTLAHGKGIFITVSDPQSDISVSSVRQKTIFGNVEDYAHDSIAVAVKLFDNGVPTGQTYSVRGKYTAMWNFPLTLNDGANRIKLVAYSPGNDSLAEKSLTIWFDPGLKDTVPPVILDITADGKPADYHYVTGDTAAIRIIAFDEGSGIDSLTVNGKPLVMTPEGYGFIWYDSVPVLHRTSGNLLWVRAKDKSGNRDSVSFTLFKNNLPEIILAPPTLQQVFVGKAFTGQITCIDRDNDTITVRKLDGPAGLTVAKKDGSISWTPLIADSGMHTVVIGVSDGYQEVTYTFRLDVITQPVTSQMARIDTLLTTYAPYLEAGKDSLVVFVHTLYDSQNTPLTFSAFLNNSPLPMNGRLLVWQPGIRDVGKRTVTIKVIDKFSRSDSMLASFTVVPPNQPCTLQVRYSTPVTPGGELDLSNATQPDTLFFSVSDPDIQAVEQDTVKIRWPASQTEMVLDSTRQFRLILAPKTGPKTKDTVCVSVFDRADHADSMKFFITYVGAASPGFTGKIFINTKSSGASIISPVLGFPLLVRLDTTYFTRSFFNAAAPNGADVRFKKSDGTPLSYQIERWDNAACVAEIWVKVDTVHPMDDAQYILMTWGSGPAIDNSNGSAVFDTASGYVGVWHMNDGSTAQNANSAQGQFNATPIGGAPNPTIRYGSGIIAGADSLSNNRFLSAGLLPTMQKVSMSAWVNPTVRTPWIKLICKSWTNFGGPYQVFSLEVTGPKDTAIQFHVGLSDGFSKYAVNKDSLKTRTWTHLAGTYDGMTMLLYVNGVQAGSYLWTYSPIPAVPTNMMPWTIGGWGGNNTEILNGKIDEPRIYRGVWGPDYIKLSYENQRIGSALLQFK